MITILPTYQRSKIDKKGPEWLEMEYYTCILVIASHNSGAVIKSLLRFSPYVGITYMLFVVAKP